MEKYFEELYSKGDHISGESDSYIDKNLTIPYDGTVINKDGDIIIWKFEVRNGKRTGLEYIYYSNGKIEQINECRGNLTFGVSKEFDQNGNLRSVSIVWNNGYLRTIHINNNKIEKIDNYKPTINRLPEKISYLFTLSNEELIINLNELAIDVYYYEN